jgi:hypothetical protein
MTDTEALWVIFGALLILAIPLIYIVARSIYIGDWRHLDIDSSWDPSKSRGRIRK